MFDMELHLPDPDGGDHLAVVTCDVDPETLDVVGTVDGAEVELDEYQQELARNVAGERIDWRRWQQMPT